MKIEVQKNLLLDKVKFYPSSPVKKEEGLFMEPVVFFNVIVSVLIVLMIWNTYSS